MRQFRFLGMALLALVMSIGFAACSSSDDGNSNSGGNATKKLVKITMIYNDGDVDTETFSYDTDGNLKSYNDGEKSCTLRWADNSVTAVWSTGKAYTCNLTNNLIENSTHYKANYTYNNDKKLTKFNRKPDVGEGTLDYNFKWDGDKLMEETQGSHCISFGYSGKTCKGFNPTILLSDAFYSEPWCIACPELLGVKSNQLPDSYKWYVNREAKITYTFDSEGYVTAFFVQADIIDGEEAIQWTETYKLTWE